MSVRSVASDRRAGKDFKKLQSYGEALRAVSDYVDPAGDLSGSDFLEESLEDAYSVISASRPDFRAEDFGLFYLAHLMQFAPSRAIRQSARSAGARYLVDNAGRLSTDLAELAIEAEEMLAAEGNSHHPRPSPGSPEDAPAAFGPSRRAYSGDGQSVSEDFVTAYGSLRASVVAGRDLPATGAAEPPLISEVSPKADGQHEPTSPEQPDTPDEPSKDHSHRRSVLALVALCILVSGGLVLALFRGL